METRILDNLVAASTQMAIVIVVGWALPLALRLRAPDVLYWYFRSLLAVVVLLPVVQPWHPRPLASAETVTAAPSVSSSAAVDPSSQNLLPAPVIAPFQNGAASIVLATVAAGLAVRLAWFAIGIWRLRRLRRAGEPVPITDDVDDLCRVIGGRAELRSVETLSQPVTFGVWRPVVLLPSAMLTLGVAQRRAVLAHELIHVQRRDWAWLVVEELLRAVFWFHPLVWWLISRVQLAREQVVDQLTVLATANRRAYMEALLAFADRSPLAPVAAFARRRHLFKRLALISQEAVMSPRRVVLTCAAMVALVLATGWYSAATFPLGAMTAEAPQSSVPGPPLPPPSPSPVHAPPPPPPPPPPDGAVLAEGRLLKVEHRVEPAYPSEARAAGARGQITMAVTIDESGNVTGSHVRGIDIRTPKDVEGATLRDVTDAMIRAATEAVRQWRFQPPGKSTVGNTVVVIRAPGDTSGRHVTAIVSHGLARFPGAENALRVGGNVKPPVKTYDVRAVYPREAQEAGVEGIVILEILIDEVGAVKEARVLRSAVLLDQAALDAVRQWRFEPTLMNGAPVPVIMTVTIDFRLQAAGRP